VYSLRSQAQPIAQSAGGTLWANSPSGQGLPTGGVRETTALGERRTGITDGNYRCKDGRWIQLMGLEMKRHMPATLKALNLSIEECNNEGIMDWRRATVLVDQVMLTKTSEEWGRVFDENGVWWKRINRFDEMMDDVQANAAGGFVSVPGVRHKLVGNPVHMSEANHIPTKGAPKYGQDTARVLRELGVSDKDMEMLVKKGVI